MDSTAIQADRQPAKRKAATRRIRAAIRLHWRTHSDRQIADLVGCSNRTIGSHRRKMEAAARTAKRPPSGNRRPFAMCF